jgi:hypothetical protein
MGDEIRHTEQGSLGKDRKLAAQEPLPRMAMSYSGCQGEEHCKMPGERSRHWEIS